MTIIKCFLEILKSCRTSSTSFLELSQLEAETIPLNKQQVELVSLLKGFTYSFMPLAEQKFISLNFSSAVDKIKYEFRQG
ncbi:MAG: hypothetical protein U5J96_00575 [Ignavibacteriaceae bacterium]|nr:hypothetical protein [Ignavibacteriaceae bacterium]